MEPLSANDPRMIGEFRLHAQLGAGGMGQVYLGFSPAGRAVAIKVIHPQFARDQEFLRRFSHEVAAASAVGGMYTAPVVDYDLQGSMPWLATAYVPGPTLATFINKHGALPEPVLWRLAAGLTEALRAVHAKGLIHRDLKPANVLLADSGPHVIDFGISRASSSMTQLTSAGMAIGTPGYMSPEQAQVQNVGPPSDIFSLGCVLAFAATGTPPFNGDNPASILFRIVSAEPDLSAVPAQFRQVVQACLKKDPAERPTPSQLVAMINELGPAVPATLGSFWPDAVARAIAAEQAAQTPSGLTPPTPFAATSTTGPGVPSGPTEASGSAGFGVSGPAPAAAGAAPASALGERAPTALATPTPPPGQVPGSTGHAPMIADGYFAAAQHPSAPSIPPVPGAPQAYSGQQPYVAPQPGGQTPPGTPPGGQAPFGPGSHGQGSFGPGSPGQGSFGQAPSGQGSFGQGSFGPNPFGQAPSGPGAPYAGQVPQSPHGMQAPSYPGQQSYPGPRPYAGPQPGGLNPMVQYTPGRRKPMAAEVPPIVLNAVRLMYIGLAVTVLNMVLSLLAFGRYDHNASLAQAAGLRSAQDTANSMAGFIAIGVVADLLGLVCWAWLAMATRRGHGWPRTAGLLLLCIYSIVLLIVMFGTHNDAGARFTAFVVWGLGLAAVIPLWSQQARVFYFAWRKG